MEFSCYTHSLITVARPANSWNAETDIVSHIEIGTQRQANQVSGCTPPNSPQITTSHGAQIYQKIQGTDWVMLNPGV